jgi:hypothetical protein
MGKLLGFIAWLIPAVCLGQLLSLPPTPDISTAGLNLILDFEVGDHTGAYYNRFLIHPEWPGGSSGITAAIGYDFGTVSVPVIKSDWAKHPDVDRLATASGIQGQRAKSILPRYRDIETPYDYALEIFNNVDLARFWELTRRTYPGFDDLRPNAKAVLVSLVFNRGSSLVGGNRREMRAIRDLVPRQDYAGMAAQLRQMKRLWPDTPGLTRRREAEAKLMEAL